jgi:cysteine sulfinate desulfinase/cysteine desulfurase-like protein
VLEAMGVDGERSLRLSTGWSTDDADVDAFVAAFPGVVERLRSLRS